LIAFTATKETDYGIETVERIPLRLSKKPVLLRLACLEMPNADYAIIEALQVFLQLGSIMPTNRVVI